MLVNTISSASEMRDEFIRMNRDDYSYQGYEVIFNYYDEFEESIEFDVIGICCEWNEESFEEFMNNYTVDVIEDESDADAIINFMDNYGSYYQITDEDTIVYLNF